MKKLEKFSNREISSEIQREIKGGNYGCCDSYARASCRWAESQGYPIWDNCYNDIMHWCRYIPSAFGC